MMNYYQAQLLNSLAVVVVSILGFAFIAQFSREILQTIENIADKLAMMIWW